MASERLWPDLGTSTGHSIGVRPISFSSMAVFAESSQAQQGRSRLQINPFGTLDESASSKIRLPRGRSGSKDPTNNSDHKPPSSSGPRIQWPPLQKSRKCRPMEVTPTAFGTWNGGRFMNYGQPLDDAQWIALVRHAWDRGIRTFLTADVYGSGQADSLLGQALSGVPRESYCLVGCIGHDFYSARRDGAKGFPRFTQSGLRVPADYASYLRMATEKSLERCQADQFDLILLHNPDHSGYTSDRVWNGMQTLREAGLTRSLGIAPGPANGFTLDLIQCFERFGPHRLGHDHSRPTGAMAWQAGPPCSHSSSGPTHYTRGGLRRYIP